MPILSQDFVGSFRLLAPIRTGRYTQVWSAINDVQQRYAAIKMLLPEFARDQEQLRTMRRELEIGQLVDHPRCLGPYEFRRLRSGACLLMNLIRGDNLRDVIKRRRPELSRRFASIVLQAAEGVAYLNSLGYIHLDLKPDNFLYSEAGDVLLIDFALARKAPSAWERFFWKNRQTSIQGTRSYLSPEQIRREPVDFRSDVYSFGCTLYQMAANVPPYTAGTSNELLSKHLHARIPDVVVDNPDATPEFADLLRRMMAKRPEDRPASVGELLSTFAGMRFLAGDESAEKAEIEQNGPPTTADAG